MIQNAKKFGLTLFAISWMTLPLTRMVALVALGICLIQPLAAKEVNLAVIGSPELEAETLLLMTSLSQRPDIQLLERAAIAKILEEQSRLSKGLMLSDSLRIGQLLKADGVVLLEKAGDMISVRTVGVDSGKVVTFSISPYPLTGVEDWAAARARAIFRTAPKLRMSAEDLLPLSFMRITSVLGGSEGAMLEENLNTLLIERLVGEPGLIVLDRERLEVAVAEQVFGVEGSAFLNSNWLVDGSVTGTSTGFLINLQMHPPSGGKIHAIRVEASDLAGLVENAATGILEKVGQPVSGWDPAAESIRFFTEAQWAAGKGIWEQAVRAVEAAVALGHDAPEILDWRWRGYFRLAQHVPGPERAGGFTSPAGRDRPAPEQVRHLARAVHLYAEGVRSGIFPYTQLTYQRVPARLERPGQPKLADNPVDAEATLLLMEAGKLIAEVGKNGRVELEVNEQEALNRLREEMLGLYTAVVETYPDVALQPRPTRNMPEWYPASKNTPPRPSVVLERLRNGKAWETEYGSYVAFVRKCLESDLVADPHFYQTVTHTVASMVERRVFGAFVTDDKDWRDAAESMLRDESLAVQYAGAILLSRAGDAEQSMEFFQRNREHLLSGEIPVDYLTEAMSVFNRTSFKWSQSRDFIESHTKAVALLTDLLLDLLNEEVAMTSDVIRQVGNLRITERQSRELLSAFDAYEARQGDSLPHNQELAIGSFREKVARRFRVPNVDTSSQPRTATVNPPPEPKLEPEPDTEPPLHVDSGWVARNRDYPDRAGVITYAEPVGDTVIVQVEHAQPARGRPAVREIVNVKLPTLTSRVVYRDQTPVVPGGGRRRAGPVHASDGEGIYFWNGKGISYLQGESIRVLDVPELVDPRFWLIGDFLYAADRDGVLLEIDRETEKYTIIASPRRRPSESALDEDPQLHTVSGIFRDSDGSLVINLNKTTAYIRNPVTGEWKREGTTVSDMTNDQLLTALSNEPRDVGYFSGSFDKEVIQRLEGGRFPPSSLTSFEHFLGNSAKPGPRPRRQLGTSLFPFSQFIEDSAKQGPHSLDVRPAASVVEGDVLWSLLEHHLQGDIRLWLLRLELSSGEFLCRPIDLSPEHDAWISRGTHRSTGRYRLLPTTHGLLFYADNAPLMRFISLQDLSVPPASP